MKTNKKTLTLEQCRALLSLTQVISSNGRGKATDHALMTSLLLCGGAARTWTWGNVNLLTRPMAVYRALKEMALGKKLVLAQFNHVGFREAHWVGGTSVKKAIFTVGSKPLTTQEVTRRLNRYGRMVGIVGLNLRTLVNTHHLFVELYGDADAVAEALGIMNPSLSPSQNTKRKSVFGEGRNKDERLHGMFRRSSLVFPR